MKNGINFLVATVIATATSFADVGSHHRPSFPSYRCPRIDGRWSDGNFSFDIFQQGCSYTAAYNTGSRAGGFTHLLSGSFNGTRGGGQITRIGRHDGCASALPIDVSVQPTGQLQIITLGTDGRCDLAPNFSATALLSFVQ